MIKFQVHPRSNKFLQLVETSTQTELEQLKVSFRRMSKSAKYDPRVKKGYWDGYFNYFEKNCVPIGLWNKLNDLKKFGYEVEIDGLTELMNLKLTKEIVNEQLSDVISALPADFVVRDYQIEAVYNILKWKFCTAELATSSGKTLMIYLILSWLKKYSKFKKLLIVVPNTNLVIQTAEEFKLYGLNKQGMDVKMIYGGQKEDIEDYDVVVGTYQSLCKKDPIWFNDFTAICIDEAHGTAATSVKKIMNMCSNTEYRFGVTGTLMEDDSAESWTIQSFLGPSVMKISPDFLMKEGYATQVKIKQIHMSYLPTEIREKLAQLKNNRDQISGGKILDLEEQLVVDNYKRFEFIVNMSLKTTKNTILLYSNVKDQYGKRIYDAIREQSSTKEVFYIDGGTPTDIRDVIKKKMEEGSNKMLIASFGTFSTGISIKNIHNIFLAESYKSEVIVKQTIGRGMRLHGDKDTFTVIDFVDDFTLPGFTNYLFNHARERLKIYNREKFPVEIHKIKL